MAYAPAKVHAGPFRIFSGVTAGATGTPPTYITHTAGVPATGTEIGLTQGEATVNYQAIKSEIMAEQALSGVDVFTTQEVSSIEFSAMEQTFNTLKEAFDATGSDSTGSGVALYFGAGTGAFNARQECIFMSAVQRNAPTKYIIFVLYKAYSPEGFKAPFSRSKETVYKLTFKGLADVSRNVGDQMGYYRFEL